LHVISSVDCSYGGPREEGEDYGGDEEYSEDQWYKAIIENETALVGVGTELAMLAATPRIKSPNTPAAAARM
jgi:hypothetical protein